jgi:parvulin-like peptidyl-prolyl isomerase
MMNLQGTRARRGALFVGGCCLLAAALLGACKRKGPEAAVSGFVEGASAKRLADLAPGDVIVSVNGVALTRGEYDAMLNRMEASFRQANPTRSIADLKSFRSMKERSLIDEFITKQVLVQEAGARGLAPAPDELQFVESLLARRAKREGKTVEQLLAAMPPGEADRIRKDIRDQALIRTFRKAEFGERLVIKDEDLQQMRERLTRYNQMCEATNALVKARAAAALERIRKGEDFAAVARDVSEDKKTAEAGGLWGEFTRSEIDDDGVRNAAFSLPVGAVSEPFDTEEGLVIIKVLERTGIDSVVAAASAQVKLGRLFFRLGELMTIPEEAEMRKELERTRLEELQSQWIPALLPKYRVEFPNGRTNLFEKAKVQPRQ